MDQTKEISKLYRPDALDKLQRDDEMSAYPKIPRLFGGEGPGFLRLNPGLNRVAKVPVIMQMETKECGAACLSMICAYYGKDVPLEQTRLDCPVTRNGISAGSIVRAARSYGFEAKGYTLETAALKADKPFPCIIHWNMKHFVVLCGFIKDDAVIISPTKGRQRIDAATFEKSFTGICIKLKPSDSFQKSPKRNRVLDFAKKVLKGHTLSVCIIIIVMVISALFGFIDPYIRKVFLDDILKDTGQIALSRFILIISLIAGAQITVNLFSTLYRLHLSGTLAKKGSSDFMKKLLCLPVSYYDHRSQPELLRRLSKNTTISMSIVDTFAPLVIQIAMMAFYLIVMIRSSLVLTAVGVITVICNLCASRYIALMRLGYARQMINDTSRLSSTTVAGIEMAQMIRACGATDGYLGRWAGYQALMNNASVNYMRIDRLLSALPAYLSAAANYIVMASGVYLTIKGSFTLGMMSAFLGYLSAFMMPADSLLDMGQTITTATADIERIEDVLDQAPDENLGDTNVLYEADALNVPVNKLSGQLSVRNVTFSYDKDDKPNVNDISLEVTQGKRIAIVGRSGCGKTTLVRLLSGLYVPDKGEITYDGMPINRIGHSRFTGSVAVVDQDIRLYDDTVTENIRMFDKSIPDDKVIRAAKDAMIHDEIMSMPEGYESRIAENGINLSGGQRERIDIARALCHDPSLLILDEATGGIDRECERRILDAIKNRGTGCIMITHRPDAIRDFDEIIMMEDGHITDRGTYDELISGNAGFAALVGNDDKTRVI